MSGIFFDSERDVGVVRVECLEEVIVSVFGSFGKTVIHVFVLVEFSCIFKSLVQTKNP